MANIISIIIPVYNSEAYLDRCIKSLITQSFSNCEFVFIDDGSTDNSKKIIKKYQMSNNKIKYFYKKNGGVSSARNYGVTKALGKYVFFLDSDDEIEPKCLSTIISLADKYDYVYTERKNIFDNKKKHSTGVNTVYTKDDFLYKIVSGEFDGFVCCGLFKKNIVEKIMFNEEISFMEDTLFLVKYLKYIKSIVNINQENANYLYFYSKDSLTNSKNIKKHIENFIYSLDSIDSETGKKYSNIIQKRKIKLIEKELRLCSTKEDYEEILNYNPINKAITNYKSLFTFCYKTNKVYIIKFYYIVRNILKKIYTKLR